MSIVKLARTFDPAALYADFLAIGDLVESTPAGYAGEGHVGWTSLCVFSAASGASMMLERAPYLRQVLAELELQLRLARLLVLAPGGAIREHQDAFLSKRIVRLHLPIVTHPDVEMHVGGERCSWQAGELWYGDFSLPHHGVNKSAVTRVHLVLDALVDENLLRLFPAGLVPEPLAALGQGGSESELDPRLLERFAFDFTLPAGFGLPDMGLADLPEATQGCLRLVDSELCVFVNQQPLLKAVPASEETLDLLGLGAEARLQYAFEGNAIRTVTLTLGAVAVYTFDVRAKGLQS